MGRAPTTKYRLRAAAKWRAGCCCRACLRACSWRLYIKTTTRLLCAVAARNLDARRRRRPWNLWAAGGRRGSAVIHLKWSIFICVLAQQQQLCRRRNHRLASRQRVPFVRRADRPFSVTWKCFLIGDRAWRHRTARRCG